LALRRRGRTIPVPSKWPPAFGALALSLVDVHFIVRHQAVILDESV
jgi:hypothetical protein